MTLNILGKSAMAKNTMLKGAQRVRPEWEGILTAKYCSDGGGQHLPHLERN